MKLKIVLKKIYKHICFRYHGIVLFRKYSQSEKEIFNNMRVYNYLFKKYNNFISEHSIDLGSGKHNNVVWWCWLQGENNAPDICKANLYSLKKNLKDKKIIIITNNNVNKYIELPNYIMKKHQDGIISNAHYSDLIRLQLLIKYGGTWIDSSVYCSGYNKMTQRCLNSDLFVYEHWNRGDESIVCSNWLISSEIGNPILILTRDLLFDYWKHNDYLINYYIFHIFFTMAAKKYNKEWNLVPKFSNLPPHMLQREMLNNFDKIRFDEIKKMSDFHKLTQKVNSYSSKSYYAKIINDYKKGQA